MTAGQLYETLKFIEKLESQSGLQKSLDAVFAALNNLVSSPANPPYQSELANALSSLDSAADKLANSLTPSRRSAINAMGGEDLFDPSIKDRVKGTVQTNAMTPSVAKDFVQDLVAKRSTFLKSVRDARQNLENLGIRESGLKADTADVAFLIPRDIFENRLGPLAKELTFIDRLMRDFSEASGEAVDHVELEQLSSSVPTISLLAGVGVIHLIGTVVNKFLDAWEKIERIRKIRAELSEMGMKGTALDELTDNITTTVDTVVEESTEIVLAKYKGSEERRKELSNAIRQDTRRLFGQIERGLTIEMRVGEKGDAQGANADELQKIANLSKTILFPPITKEPLLLENGELLEGEIKVEKTSKKTTTHKTTTSKKETQKEDK